MKAGQPPRSVDECKAQVRKRGRALGQAITEVYPDMILLFIGGLGTQAKGRQLLMPFIDGMLEGAGPNVTFHDGGEHGYPLKLYSSFKKLRAEAERKGQEFSSIRKVFEKRVRFGLVIIYLTHQPSCAIVRLAGPRNLSSLTADAVLTTAIGGERRWFVWLSMDGVVRAVRL